MEVAVTITIQDIINYFEYSSCNIHDDELIELYHIVKDELNNRGMVNQDLTFK